jgi:hypothetical protein
MTPQREPRPASDGLAEPASTGGFGRPRGGRSSRVPRTASGSARSGSQVIPDQVANRMARRVAIATGLPTLLGMGVFVASYLLVSRQILAIPPSVTLLASGACFLLGLVGLSYGVLSASWEEMPGSLLGIEQIGVNISRIRSSLQAMRRGSDGSAG